MDLSVGFSFVTSVTTGREAHAGERCQCSSSKKNRGAPEKLTAGTLHFGFKISDYRFKMSQKTAYRPLLFGMKVMVG